MDSARMQQVRELLAGTGWVERTRDFAKGLHRPAAAAGSLLLVGTPNQEPWHLAAHLGEEANLSGLTSLTPTLLRWAPPSGAPPHLSVGLDRLASARRGETVFVVAPELTPEHLLQRVADAKRTGATILALDSGDVELGALAHDRLLVPTAESLSRDVDLFVSDPTPPCIDMELAQHLVSLAAGEQRSTAPLRGRLAMLLERLSGAPPTR